MSKNSNLTEAKTAKNDEFYTRLSDTENELNQIKVKDLSKNVQRYVHITEHNIATIYESFLNRVVRNKNKLTSHDLVSVFMGVITNGDEYYQHPTKKNILVTQLGNIDINGDGFKSFFSYFQRNYTPQEKNNLTAIADRLIEDTDRRNNGDFWTPTLFVDYAHKMISEQLGEDWKDKYVVWDNCCGAKNLTRDYKFKELYCSTLFDSELKIGERYNKEAVSFQYDFLNDDLEKLPKGLLEAFEQNKPIVFFLNPPYGKATGAGGHLDAGSSESKIKQQMQQENIEGSEFIKQFLWRIVDIKRTFNLTNLYVAIFTKPSWLTKPQSQNFRKLFLDNFVFEKGVMFQASEFTNVSSLWGITFNIWKCGISKERNNFKHQLIENIDGEIKIIQDKILYNFDNLNIKTTSEFISEKLCKKHKGKIVYCKDIKNFEYAVDYGNIYDNYICNVNNNGNDISANSWSCIRDVYPFSGGGSLQLTKDNIFESSIVLALRKLVQTNWIIDKDMYNMNVEIPISFRNDAFVYSIFGNYCCSIKLDNDQLKNEFFWMSKQEIEDLANTYKNDDCYADVHTASERFVYQKLQEIELSPEAQAVLDKANEIVKKTFPYRNLYNDSHPEVQINNWDCGWYQIKGMLKMFMPNELKEFQQLYKTLSDKMRPMVYELGFLK